MVTIDPKEDSGGGGRELMSLALPTLTSEFVVAEVGVFK
jgi:hypothetical protein